VSAPTHSLWRPRERAPAFDGRALHEAVHRIRESVAVIRDPASGRLGVGVAGEVSASSSANGAFEQIALLPALYPEWLGDRSFGEVHGARFPYVSGAMANGIATREMVSAMARAGFLGFFGAAGLSFARVEAAIDALQAELDPLGLPWGSNLIHSPNEPALETAVADLYIRRGVRRVSASAYMALTPAIVRYAATGLHRDAAGRIQRTNFVFAKVSRPEVARRFLEPAPATILAELVAQGLLTAEEAQLAAEVPLAEDITCEADSGGHTDNRPLTALLPTILGLAAQITAERGYQRPVRVGAAGGLGTPSAVAAAFGLGAAYVVTGSINQGCLESGLHASGRAMLAAADIADVIMAPAADMFELGVEVQVLRRGTMFASRARKLYELYRTYDSLDAVPAPERERIERDVLRASFADSWASTREFWSRRDPGEVERAERDPRHLMALVLRSYLGLASRWAIDGLAERRADYQIWCGPAMGAFNAWAQGSFLEAPEHRAVVQVARNLMEGAAVVTRAQQLRSFGLPIPPAAFEFRPRPLA
jgi:trans-AT polyketide synthase, acyltransferase and oxidoreductase domains